MFPTGETNKKAVLFRSAYTTLHPANLSILAEKRGTPGTFFPVEQPFSTLVLQGKSQEHTQNGIDEYTDRSREEENDKQQKKQPILLEHQDSLLFDREEGI